MMSKEEYALYLRSMQPRSPMGRDLLLAFLTGGLICALGELLIALYSALGLPDRDASLCCSMTLVFLAAFLTGIGVYDDIARFAGAGTLVPITGFSNAMVAPALEFRHEGFILGSPGKMFTIAGPVLVCGISASVVYGLILCVFG